MNRIRTAISLFMAVVLALLIQGWNWTAAHQSPAQARASHVVLALGIVSGLVGLAALWRRPSRPPR